MKTHELRTSVKGMQGRTLPTKHGKLFDVIAVDEKRVTVRPQATGKLRPIPWQEFERADALGLPPEELTATALRNAGATVANPVYIVAILKAVSGMALPSAPSHGEASVVIQPQQMSVEESTAQLERLAHLHRDGALSQKEYDLAKLRLLRATE